MVFDPSFKNRIDTTSRTVGPVSTEGVEVFGRVVDVILDKTHPEYTNNGGSKSINGVFYKNIDESTVESDNESNFSFAYSYDPNLIRVPLIGEIVKIHTEPTSTPGGNEYPFSNYYTTTVNIWNTPHHNALPEPKLDFNELDLGSNVVELESITGIQPYTGDLILEGRLGQSLRFSGYKHPSNKFTDNNNNGQPFTILKVGQDPGYNSLNKYVEDINKDFSSIYLTSNHSIPLEISTKKLDTFKQEDEPTKVREFKGNQIVVDSGRLILHSKNDSLFLNSKRSILAGSETFNIDATSYISTDAPQIYIGAEAEEPAVLGNQNEKLLRRLFNLLQTIASTLNSVTDLTLVVSALTLLGPIIEDEVNGMTTTLESIKSKKVKVE